MKLGLKLHVCKKTANSSDVHLWVMTPTLTSHTLCRKELGSGHAGMDPEIDRGRVYIECGSVQHPQHAVV